MKSKTILSLLLFFLALSACQEKELNNEEKKILTEWVPAFQKNKVLSGITETERLVYSFDENRSRGSNEVKRVYPRYLGGYYRCADNGKIVVSLTDTSQIIKDDLIRLCSLTPGNITFKLCEYSLNEIFDLQKQIAEIPDIFEKWNIMTVGNDLEKNRVLIRFYGKYDENKINSFKKEISDSPMIDFWFLDDELPEPSDSSVSPVSRKSALSSFSNNTVHNYDYDYEYPYPYIAHPGDSVITHGTKFNNLSSIGFLLDYGAHFPEGSILDCKGFVTAAHGVENVGNEGWLYFSRPSGLYRFALVDEIDSQMDVAVCTSFDMYAKLSADYDPVARCLYVGERVTAKGSPSGGYDPGFVIGVGEFRRISRKSGITICCSVMNMNNQIRKTFGDSGGIVLSDNNQVAGIMVATDIEKPWFVYFIPALEICYRFNEVVGI